MIERSKLYKTCTVGRLDRWTLLAISWFLPDDKKTLAFFTFQSNTNMNSEYAEIHNILNYAKSEIISTDPTNTSYNGYMNLIPALAKTFLRIRSFIIQMFRNSNYFSCYPGNANMFTWIYRYLLHLKFSSMDKMSKNRADIEVGVDEQKREVYVCVPPRVIG